MMVMVTTWVLMVVADHLLHLAFERVERVRALGVMVVSAAHLTVFGDALGGATLSGRWLRVLLVVMVDFGLVCCRGKVLVAHVSLMVVQVADGLAGV